MDSLIILIIVIGMYLLIRVVVIYCCFQYYGSTGDLLGMDDV
jgi:hypothetical protein